MCIFFTDLEKMQQILDEANVMLCKYLNPSGILLTLKANRALTPADVQRIDKKDTVSDKVEMLLDILHRKEKEAYFALMVALRKERQDLFNKVVEIEWAVKSGI